MDSQYIVHSDGAMHRAGRIPKLKLIIAIIADQDHHNSFLCDGLIELHSWNPSEFCGATAGACI